MVEEEVEEGGGAEQLVKLSERGFKSALFLSREA